jgi:hypothetical protein
MHYFATQLVSSQQTTQSLRARQYNVPNKRKRDEDTDDPDNNNVPQSPTGPITSSIAGPGSLEPSQLRVAGLLPDDASEIPPPPFPHGLARTLRNVPTHAKIQEDIARLNPAVYDAAATSKSDAIRGKSESERHGLRKTHLHVLSTIMHRCLLEGDYDRAARAWGMILRTQVAGEPIDPRNHGRWGIGAELLLRRKPLNSHHDPTLSIEQEMYTREGLAMAQDYYRLFATQYNHQKWLLRAVDTRTFYPPLFTIWIKEIIDRSARARQKYRNELRRASSASADSENDTSISLEETRMREAAIQAEELSHVRALCEELDSKVKSPPFDKLPGLLCLRGNVGLWLSDLLVGRSTRTEQEDDVDNFNIDHDSNFGPDTNKSRKHAKSLEELEKALSYFSRAETNGAGNMDTTKYSIEIKIKEVTKQMERFDG